MHTKLAILEFNAAFLNGDLTVLPPSGGSENVGATRQQRGGVRMQMMSIHQSFTTISLLRIWWSFSVKI